MKLSAKPIQHALLVVSGILLFYCAFMFVGMMIPSAAPAEANDAMIRNSYGILTALSLVSVIWYFRKYS